MLDTNYLTNPVNSQSPSPPPCQLIPPHLWQQYSLPRLQRHHLQIITNTIWFSAGYRYWHSYKCDAEYGGRSHRTVESYQWSLHQIKESSPVGCFMQVSDRPLQPQVPSLSACLI